MSDVTTIPSSTDISAASVSAILSMALCAAVMLTSWMSARTVRLPLCSRRRWPRASPISPIGALSVAVVAEASARLRRAVLSVRVTESTTEAFVIVEFEIIERSAFSLSLSSAIKLVRKTPAGFQPVESKSDGTVATSNVTLTTDR